MDIVVKINIALIGWGKPICNFFRILKNHNRIGRIIIITHPKKKHEEDTKYFSNNFIYEDIFKLKNNSIIIQTKSISSKIVDLLEREKIDLIISSGSKFIFKKNILSKFKKKIVNFHPSYLPDGRGGANFTYRILQKGKFIAATVHFVNDKIDAGEIIIQKKIYNIKNFDLNEYFIKTYNLYNKLFLIILKNFFRKKLYSKPQIEKNATHAKKLKSDIDGKINLNWNINEIDLFIKSFSRPYKGAFCFLNNKKIYILKSIILKKESVHPFLVGKIKKLYSDKTCSVYVNGGILKILEVSDNLKIYKPIKYIKLHSRIF